MSFIVDSWWDEHEDNAPDRAFEDERVAIYDYSPAGALLLAYEQDNEFTKKLRALVPQGFITWTKKPYHWVIDADYGDDVLALCREYFEYVEHGTIGG